jgi:DHA1 family bicyclomycin/chloramphenicol resistance-like MFS transporter
MVMAVVPALSPAVGGYLDVWVSWRAGFVLLALYGFGVLAAALPWLTETNRYLGSSSSAIGHISGFAILLRTRVFVGFGLHCVCTLAAWYALVAGAPYVMVAIMGYPPSDYGLWFVVVAAGWIVGNFLTARTAARIGAERLVLIGAVVAIAASIVLANFVAVDALSPPRLFGPLAVIGLGHGLSQPSAMACAIGVRLELAGRASGLLGFVQMATGAAAAQLVGVMLSDSVWPLAIMVVGFSLLSLAAWAIAVTARAGA